MADNTVILNGDAPFVEDDLAAAEADIYPGNCLELDSNGDVIKSSAEAAVGTQAVGRGLFADLNSYDPNDDKTTAYANSDTVRCVYVPVGGKIDARLAAGGDLTTSADANVTTGDILEEADVGGLKKHTGNDVDPTSTTTETTYDRGALYMALESVDNSAAAAGVANQKNIEVVRIA